MIDLSQTTVDARASANSLSEAYRMPLKVFSDINIDTSAKQLSSATVEVRHGDLGDILHVSKAYGLNVSYSGGKLHLKGDAPVEAYERVLESLTFETHSKNLDTGSAREVVVEVMGASSNPVQLRLNDNNEVFISQKDNDTGASSNENNGRQNTVEKEEESSEASSAGSKPIEYVEEAENGGVVLTAIENRIHEVTNDEEMVEAMKNVEDAVLQMREASEQQSLDVSALPGAFEQAFAIVTEMNPALAEDLEVLLVKIQGGVNNVGNKNEDGDAADFMTLAAWMKASLSNIYKGAEEHLTQLTTEKNLASPTDDEGKVDKLTVKITALENELANIRSSEPDMASLDEKYKTSKEKQATLEAKRDALELEILELKSKEGELSFEAARELGPYNVKNYNKTEIEELFASANSKQAKLLSKMDELAYTNEILAKENATLRKHELALVNNIKAKYAELEDLNATSSVNNVYLAGLQTQIDSELPALSRLKFILSGESRPEHGFFSITDLLDRLTENKKALADAESHLKTAIEARDGLTSETNLLSVDARGKAFKDFELLFSKQNFSLDEHGYYNVSQGNVTGSLLENEVYQKFIRVGDLFEPFNSGPTEGLLKYDKVSKTFYVESADGHLIKLITMQDLGKTFGSNVLVDGKTGKLYFESNDSETFQSTTAKFAEGLETFLDKLSVGPNAGEIDFTHLFSIKEGVGAFTGYIYLMERTLFMADAPGVKLALDSPGLDTPAMRGLINLFGSDFVGLDENEPLTIQQKQIAFVIKNLVTPEGLSAMQTMMAPGGTANPQFSYDPITQTLLIISSDGTTVPLIDFQHVIANGTLDASQYHISSGTYYQDIYQSQFGTASNLNDIWGNVQNDAPDMISSLKANADKALYKISTDLGLDSDNLTPDAVEAKLLAVLTKLGMPPSTIGKDVLAEAVKLAIENDGNLDFFYNPSTKMIYFLNEETGEYLPFNGKEGLDAGEGFVVGDTHVLNNLDEAGTLLQNLDASFLSDLQVYAGFISKNATIHSADDLGNGVTRVVYSDGDDEGTLYYVDMPQSLVTQILADAGVSAYERVPQGTPDGIVTMTTDNLTLSTATKDDANDDLAVGNTYTVTGTSADNIMTVASDLLIEDAGTHFIMAGGDGSDSLSVSDVYNFSFTQHFLTDGTDYQFTMTNNATGGLLGVFDLTSIEWFDAGFIEAGTSFSIDASGFSSSEIASMTNKNMQTMFLNNSLDNVDSFDLSEWLTTFPQYLNGTLIFTVMAGDGNDVLIGAGSATQAASTIFSGGAGDDTLIAGVSTVGYTLDGGAGNDQLRSGSGKDFMKGGDGDDTFIFSADFGTDIVTDAGEFGEDTLRFSGINVADVTGGRSDGGLGDNLIITQGEDTVTVVNYYVNSGDITLTFADGNASVDGDGNITPSVI
ncbi:MAG: hypothetical protein DHS20C10_06200 [marine bacterium B5-7]|nr:MAG: hypothetical protein DHS20C10_06200 [marine bacterium B5-7]